MKIEEAISRIKNEIEQRQISIAWIESRREQLDQLAMDSANVWNAGIDFDNLKHSEIVKIISVLGGKWQKEVNGDRIDYSTSIDGMKIRCWKGEPPPACKIVEVQEVIPEQIVTRRKLVCPQAEEQMAQGT